MPAFRNDNRQEVITENFNAQLSWPHASSEPAEHLSKSFDEFIVQCSRLLAAVIAINWKGQLKYERRTAGKSFERYWIPLVLKPHRYLNSSSPRPLDSYILHNDSSHRITSAAHFPARLNFRLKIRDKMKTNGGSDSGERQTPATMAEHIRQVHRQPGSKNRPNGFT